MGTGGGPKFSGGGQKSFRSKLHKKPVHIIEARSILGAVKHRSRDHHAHGTRILVLNDNMGVVLACQKGRCSNYSLLRIIRRISAHALAAGLRVYVRWIPSELNTADKGSRWFSKMPSSHAVAKKGSKREVTVFTRAEVQKSNSRMKSPSPEVLVRKKGPAHHPE